MNWQVRVVSDQETVVFELSNDSRKARMPQAAKAGLERGIVIRQFRPLQVAGAPESQVSIEKRFGRRPACEIHRIIGALRPMIRTDLVELSEHMSSTCLAVFQCEVLRPEKNHFAHGKVP
jgi:hypothetical protein